jgi:hypothetical protein
MRRYIEMKQMLGLLIVALGLAAAPCWGQSVSGPKSVQLTVYNDNFALVKDARAVTLAKGINSIEVGDVAARIDPTSILFKSLTAPNSVAILEQNYQYDLINPDNILNKSVGQRVTFTSFDSNGKPYVQSGILMNPATIFQPGSQDQYGGYRYPSTASSGGVVIKTDSGQVVMRPEGQVSVEKMPEGLHPKPTLNWLLTCDKAGSQDFEVSYITEGVGWKADYVALVNKDDAALDLTGWVTLDNRSGASYADAKLTLMAGDVRRVQPEGRPGSGRATFAGSEIAAAPQFEEKTFFEYHMYTMQRPTTIRDNETKQLSLLGASEVATKKEMIYDGRRDWWRSWWYPGRTGDPGGGYDTSNYHKVNVVLEVKNAKENHMGMPLPKGKVRVYKLDEAGSQQFIGEDMIDHTPKDEKIRLYIGDAFDVVGDYKRSDYKKIASNVIEESFEVDVRNHKDAAVEVKVVDHVWSDWTVTQSSHKYNKKDAHTIEFPVTVPANGEVKVTYTIRTEW